jgi:hypothetical protein
VWFFRLTEQIAKRPAVDALSAKVQVLEAENESLKTFLKESSEKETIEKKKLFEKHARDMAELADKLKKSQQRVSTLATKNKSQEAEAEAIDKMIFRKDLFCLTPTSSFFALSAEETDRNFLQRVLASNGPKNRPSKGLKHMMKRGVQSMASSKRVAESPGRCP